MADGTDEESAYAASMDEWIERWDSPEGRRLNCYTVFISFLFSYCMGVLLPRDLRTAYRGGRRIFYVVADRLRGGSWLCIFLVCVALLHIP